MVIYKITNTIDGKSYVGKTTGDATKRFERHCRPSSRCTKLAAAIKKYGRIHFTLDILDKCTSESELNQKEIYWIEKLNTVKEGYNLTLGGDGGLLSEETKKKISVARLGSKASLLTRKNFSENRKGHLNSKAKPVVVIQDGIETTFKCLKYAADFYSINYSTARSIAQGQNTQTRNGLIFRYVRV